MAELVKSGSSKSTINIIPLTATVQYHFMPDSQISPYVGAGYSYQIMSGGPKGMKIANGGGIVGQVGVDIPMGDNMSFNVDVKYTHKASHDLKIAQTKLKNNISTVSVLAGVAFPL